MSSSTTFTASLDNTDLVVWKVIQENWTSWVQGSVVNPKYQLSMFGERVAHWDSGKNDVVAKSKHTSKVIYKIFFYWYWCSQWRYPTITFTENNEKYRNKNQL